MVFTAIILSTSIYAQNKADIEKEKTAIIKVITDGTNAYRAKDLNKMATTYVNDESTVKIRVNKTGYSVTNGWENIAALYKENFTNNPAPVTSKFEKVNFKIKVYPESAWAIHDEIQTGAEGQKSKQIIVHFLEKHEDAWKVVYMSQVFASSYDVAEE